jgi:DNA-binding PadR family transcriptional regulator
MSVRAGLLAILSLGPAYGLQVRDEFLDRAPHRTSVNVGQIYSTLDRLMTAGLVRNRGLTDDGLPLYGLTDAGEDAAAEWVRVAEANPGDRIDDLLDQVLIVSSLPGADVALVVAGYRAQLASDALGDRGDRGDGSANVQRVAAEAARRGIREALVAWLDEFERTVDAGPDASRPQRDVRPSRGRRPGSTLA